MVKNSWPTTNIWLLSVMAMDTISIHSRTNDSAADTHFYRVWLPPLPPPSYSSSYQQYTFVYLLCFASGEQCATAFFSSYCAKWNDAMLARQRVERAFHFLVRLWRGTWLNRSLPTFKKNLHEFPKFGEKEVFVTSIRVTSGRRVLDCLSVCE